MKCKQRLHLLLEKICRRMSKIVFIPKNQWQAKTLEVEECDLTVLTWQLMLINPVKRRCSTIV